MFNIENFSASIGRTGVARASHFMFIINVPSNQNKSLLTQNLIGQTFLQEVRKLGTAWENYGTTHLAFRCDRVSMPGRIVIFDGSIPHTVMPMNIRSSPVYRFTIALKWESLENSPHFKEQLKK